MSWTTTKAGLKTALEAVSGIRYVIGEVPKAVQATPMIWFVLGSFDRDPAVQPVKFVYHVEATLMILWQDFKEAEEDLDALVSSVASAFCSDPSLGGILGGGAAMCIGGETDWIKVTTTEYRSLTFYIDVTEYTCCS